MRSMSEGGPRRAGSPAAAGATALVVLTLAWLGPRSLSAVGVSWPPSASAACAVLAVVLLGLSARGVEGRRAWSSGVLALPPAAVAVGALARGDEGDAWAPALAVLVVVLLVLSPSERLPTWSVASLSLLVGTSIVAAAVDPRLALQTRDFLPGVVDGRAVGLLGHPNALGMLAALLVVQAATLPAGGWRRVGWSTGVMGLLASASQTALVASAAALCVYLIVRGRPWRSGGTVVGACGVVAVAGALLVVLPPVDLPVHSTLTGRTEIWAQLWQEAPGLLGVSASELDQRLAAVAGVGTTHNTWLEAYLRGGWFGLVALVVAVVLTTAVTIRARQPMAWAFLAFVLVTSLTEGVLFAMPFIAHLLVTLRLVLKPPCASPSTSHDGAVDGRVDRVVPRGPAAIVGRKLPT